MFQEVNLDNVEIVDGNELAKTHLQNLPKEPVPEGVVFNGVDCVDCGFEIEKPRLAQFNTCRCGECKMWFEKEQARKALNGNPLYEDE